MTTPHDDDDAAAFLAAVVHKLGSTVGAVANYARLLDEDLDAELAEGLHGAVERSQRVLEKATRWLDALDLLGPVEAVELRAALIRAHAAVPDVALEAGTLPTVTACPGALAFVFEELLRNAAQAAGDARAQVDVTAEADGANVTVAVADRGPGWSADEAERALRPFRPGVGLAIVSTLMRAMGGSVRTAPGEAGGAIVYLSLPAADAPIMAEEEPANP